MLREHYEQRLLLLFFHFRKLIFMLNVAEHVNRLILAPIDIDEIKKELIAIKSAYTRMNDDSENDVLSAKTLKERNKELKSLLKKIHAFSLQIKNYNQLVLSLNKSVLREDTLTDQALLADTRTISLALTNTDRELNTILDMINRNEKPSIKMRTQYEKHLKNAKENIENKVAKILEANEDIQPVLTSRLLRYALENDYSSSMKQIRRILLLKNWYAKIENDQDALHSLDNKWVRIFKIKTFLGSVKLQFYIDFFKCMAGQTLQIEQHLYCLLARSLITQNPDPLDSKIDALFNYRYRLDEEEKTQRFNIARREQALIQYTLTESCLINGVRFWTESFYYRFSEHYISFMEEMTRAQRFENYSLLNVTLTDNYKTFFTLLSSGVLLKLDNFLYGSWGTSYLTLNSLGHLLLANNLLLVSERLGFDESSVLNYLEPLRFLLGLLLHVLFFTALSDLPLGMAVLPLTLCYVIGSAIRHLAGYGIDTIGDRSQQNNPHPNSLQLRHLFVKPWVQQLGYVAGYALGRKLYQHGYSFWDQKNWHTRLLSEPALCDKHAEECQQVALKELNLPKGAQGKDIQRAWRKIGLTHHPDKVTDQEAKQLAIENLVLKQNARARLLQFQ